MKRTITVLILIVASLPQIGAAVDFGIQPRLEGGVMFYKYEQDAFVGIDTAQRGEVAAQTGLKVEDTLPFIGGGITMFADRFFVDFGIQYADNGSDSPSTSQSNFRIIEDGANLASVQDKVSSTWDTDFDRTEFAITLGYSVTNRWVVYAGYKRAETDFESKRTGSFTRAFCGSPSITTTGTTTIDASGCSFAGSTNFTEDNKLNFEQDGPFIGTTFGWDIDRGFMQGILRGNIAIALMDGTVEETRTNIRDANGDPLDSDSKSSFDGDTVGVSLGVTWHGKTAIDRLNYQVALDGYQYNYDGDQNQDFTEEVIRFKLGLAYAFDL